MLARSRIVQAAALALATLAGYATPRPESRLVIPDVASKSLATCPKVGGEALAGATLQIEALTKDLALRDARIRGLETKAALRQEPKAPAQKVAQRPRIDGWRQPRNQDRAALWTASEDRFQPW